MKASVCIIFVAIASSKFVDAGHHHHSSGSLSTAPQAIAESDRTTTCPHGFKPHGKECIRTVTVAPTAHCPIGFVRFVEDEHVCVKFFEKVSECPIDFFREKGVCVKTHQFEPLVQCPHGFTLMSDGHQCFRNVPLPREFFCPSGSVRHGEVCIKKHSVQPEFVCPPRFTFVEDKRCKTVETFDCTPADVHFSESHKHHHKHLRLLGEKSKKSSVVMSKETPPIEKEHVIQKTCERVRLESADKVCPEGSVHHGKECLVEEKFPFHEKHGGFKEEIVKAVFVCPEGHHPTSTIGRFHCLVKEETPIKSFCPDDSESVDHRCAKFRPFILRCPSDHKFEDGHCLKTIVVPPTVEFNVRFKCQGKDCDHHQQITSPKHFK